MMKPNPDYRHEEIAPAPHGWRVRTVPQDGHLVRVAFPPGPRRRGAGQIVSILHPLSENPYTCNPEGLPLSLCVDPQESLPGEVHPSLCVDPEPARGNPVAEQIEALESKSVSRPLSKKEAAQLRALRIQAAWGNPFSESRAHIGAVRYFVRPRGIARGGWELRSVIRDSATQTEKDGGLIGVFQTKAEAHAEKDRLNKKLRSRNPQAMSYLLAAKKAAEEGQFEKGMKLLGKYAKKKTTDVEAEILRKKTLQKNASTGAAQMYKDFHGRDPSQVLEMQDALLRAGEYTALGDDPEIWLRPVTGDPAKWGDAEITFPPEDGVKLATDGRGGQLFFVGENQAVSLSELRDAGLDTSKRFIPVGEAYAISYTTEKVFDGFRSVPYAHRFGDEGGERPLLIYDKDTRRLLLVGGSYSIAPVDGGIGASPGIVN